MNIIIRTATGACIVRPDTTMEKNNGDIFAPDYVNSFQYTTVLFARIARSGKCIGREFASRYYEGINYGILLYPGDFLDRSAESVAKASCIDRTTILPFPVYNNATLDQGNPFRLRVLKSGKRYRTVFTHTGATAAIIEEALSEVSKYTYPRQGDILAIELHSRRPLCKRAEGDTLVRSDFCGNTTMDFLIRF